MSTTLVSELTPGTIEKKGIAYAPRTLASLVYMDDGTKISDILKEMLANGKRFILRTKTEQLEVSFNGQRIYDIPTPLERYNFDKFPLIVSINGVIVDPSNYAINERQLILTQEFSASVKQNDIMMFIFHYLDIIIEDGGINAESINNVRFYVSKSEPRHKKSTDVWFDTEFNEVKQFDGEDWQTIVSGSNNKLYSQKNTVIVDNSTDIIEIGIPKYDKDRDILFVYVNSTYLQENDDYTVSEDNLTIRSVGKNWDGSEEPQIFNFLVFKNIITVENPEELVPALTKRMKSQLSRENLLSTIDDLQKTVKMLTIKVSQLEKLAQK